MVQTAGVILAAGQGTRMRSATPKVLHRLVGRPMVQWVVSAFEGAGIQRIVVVVGHGAEQVEAALGPDVETVRQPEPRGTADAVRHAARVLATGDGGEDVVIAYGDCPLLTSSLFRKLIERRRETGAVIALVASPADDPRGYGRVIRDCTGQVTAIVEEASATEAERAVRETNAGVYCVRADWLWEHLPAIRPSDTGELYLTDLVALAVAEGLPVQAIDAPLSVTAGVNDRLQLAAAEAILRDRVRQDLMRSGVTLLDPASTYVDATVVIGPDSVILPGTLIEGTTTIGARCTIGPHSRIVDSRLGDDVTVTMSVIEQAEVADQVRIGPFSHLRPGARIGPRVVLGNYAEVKNARVGADSRMQHFSYLGDAEVGEGVNVGAGTITANFDSETGTKNRTRIGDGASLGCDTILIAPVTIGPEAMTAAGAVVTHDVEASTVVAGVPARPMRRRRRGSSA